MFFDGEKPNKRFVRVLN